MRDDITSWLDIAKPQRSAETRMHHDDNTGEFNPVALWPHGCFRLKKPNFKITAREALKAVSAGVHQMFLR